MKKLRFLSMAMAVGMMFTACNNDDDNTGIVKNYDGKMAISLAKELGISVTETKASDNTLNANDYVAVQVFEKLPAASDYSIKYVGVYSGDKLASDKIVFDTEKDAMYKIACACVEDIAGNKDFSSEAAPFKLSDNSYYNFTKLNPTDDNGTPGDPADDDNSLVDATSTVNFVELTTGGINLTGGKTYFCQNNRYYAEVEDVKDDAGTTSLELMINFFKFQYKAQGMKENHYLKIRVQNEEADLTAKKSATYDITKAVLESADGKIYDYNLKDQSPSAAGETVWLVVEYYDGKGTADAGDDVKVGETIKQEINNVSRKKKYAINIDVKQKIGITLEDVSNFTDGSSIDVDM